ncbi:MAG: apolipoprotein N-acyltransferase [Alphaproteobacteria bacterium]|nr:apolipoprotein N-acyltransferase [Alphaproteobacteria bacterium]
MKVLITIQDDRWKKIKLNYKKIITAALGDKDAEVSVLLTNDAGMQKLNKQWRGKDKPTNVLSFETGDPEIMGDIVLSYDTILAESSSRTFKTHAARMLIHGALHLAGMDHIKDADAKKMEATEAKILLKIRREKWRGLMFFALGAAASFGFAPYYLWPATIAALGLAYRFARGYKDGFWFGAGYAILGLSWMVNSFFVDPTAAQTFGYLAPFALIGIAAGGGLLFGLPFWLTGLTRDNTWRRPFYFAAAWAFVLWLRGWFLTGFPWNPLAGIFIETPVISNMAGVIGIITTSFLIAGICAAILSKKLIPILFFSAALIATGVASTWRVANYHNNLDLNPTVRIVQPAIPQAYKSDRRQAQNNFEIVMELSNRPGEFDFIVWPESAYPYLVTPDFSIDLPAPLVFGGLRREAGIFFNSMFVFQGGEITQLYDKRHLVPFGEFSPFGKLVPVPGEFGFGRRDQGAMKIAGVKFAPSICYEIIFPDTAGAASAQFIINITNDGWFGDSIGPHQHLMMARLRAIESGLPVIRASYSGISAIIDPLGRVTHKLDLGVRGIIDTKIPFKMATGVPTPNRAIINILIIALALRLIRIRARPKKD